MGNLMIVIRRRPDLGRTRAVRYLVLVDIVLRSLEINRELGVVRQRLILGVVLVQGEVVVVGYVGVGLDSRYVTGRPGLGHTAKVQLRTRVVARALIRLRRLLLLSQLLTESLV